MFNYLVHVNLRTCHCPVRVCTAGHHRMYVLVRTSWLTAIDTGHKAPYARRHATSNQALCS